MMSRTSVDNLSQMLACLKERKELEELKEAAIAQLEAATLELALSHAKLMNQEIAAAIEASIVTDADGLGLKRRLPYPPL